MQTSQSSSSAAERRQNPRTKLAEIAYIGMGPENGGLVLDVSEGGLSFHSVAPIQREEKVQFLLSLRGHSRIEGTGEVVWTNNIGTVCGLKFTSLSPDALEQLNHWTTQSSTSAPVRAKIPAPVKPSVSTTPESTASSLSVATAEPVFAIPPAEESSHSVHITELHGQSPLFWMGVGALTMLVASLTFWFGVHVGKSEFSEPRPTAAITETQESPPAVPAQAGPHAPIDANAQMGPADFQTASKIDGTVPAHALVNAVKTEAAPSQTSAIPVTAKPVSTEPVATGTAAAARTTTATPVATVPTKEPKAAAISDANPRPSSDTGKSEYDQALADLNGDNGKRDTDSAVRLLQIAIKKGNTVAEVTLADLYIYGDGVAQDCDRGKTLLADAEKNGNAQARVKLDELNAGGCP